jgi:hypothetical protein
MTRDLADTVKALAQKAIRDSGREYTAYAINIVEVFEPAIRELIAQEREVCAKIGHTTAFEFLDMHRNQRQYSWHDVEDALTAGSKAIRARGDKSLAEHDAKIRREAYLRCADDLSSLQIFKEFKSLHELRNKWANEPLSGGKADGGGK